MFDPVLVPLDGSQLAECVLPHAAAFARAFEAEITLFRMLEKNRSSVPGPLFDLLNWQINKTQATLYLEKTKAGFKGSNIRVQTVVREGLVAEGITEYAQNQGMELIILSSHGQSGLTQSGISSITQKVILSAPTSVLIVRASQRGIQANEYPDLPFYQRIMVPLDGSQRAEHVIPIVIQLARANKAQVCLVQVVQTPEMARQMPLTTEDIDLSNRVVARNREEAGNYLEHMKVRSSLEGIAIQTHLLTSDNAPAALHELVEQEQIDLVTLSAHGYSGKREWPYGSLVHNFILYGSVPLLIVQDLPARQNPIPHEPISRERPEH